MKSQRTEIHNRYRKALWLILSLWTLITALSLGVMGLAEFQRSEQLAREVAVAMVDKDLSYRLWASSHGGVYVPVSPQMSPNPWLKVPNRDVVTQDGVALTLVNPAFMTRMVYEQSQKLYGLRSHITSLNPIRPENAPDPWEAVELARFERDPAPGFALQQLPEGEYYRYIRPMVTAESCLKCHGDQGYAVGDIRGALSVSLPTTPFVDIAWRGFGLNLAWQGGVWLVVCGGLVLASRKLLARRLEAQRQQEAFNQQESIYRTIIQTASDGFWKVGGDGTIQEINQSYAEMSGWPAEAVCGRLVSEFEASQDPAAIGEMMARIKEAGRGRFETTHRTRDGGTVHLDVSVSCPAGEPQIYYAFLRDLSQIDECESRLQAVIRDREVLLKELYHRTKNNMQVITALLELQIEQSRGEAGLAGKLKVAQERIQAMALVHEKLYQSQDLSRIDLGDYAESLVAIKQQEAHSLGRAIAILYQRAPAVQVPIEKAIPCGLFLNECLTNALKHAFPGERSGSIQLLVGEEGPQEILVSVKDDGVGFDSAAPGGGLGMGLIKALALQLGGRVQVESSPGQGVHYRLVFPLS